MFAIAEVVQIFIKGSHLVHGASAALAAFAFQAACGVSAYCNQSLCNCISACLSKSLHHSA